MLEADLIYLASIALGKNFSYEDFQYSDYLYGNEEFIDSVWEYVTEAREEGLIYFKDKYKGYTLYPAL